MKAVYYETFGGPISIKDVPYPALNDDGVILKVKASGLCRSDWHGWMGHDRDITLPHVPGHEMAGIIEAIGSNVKKFKKGDRVTLPFVCGCGTCRECESGNQQVCDFQFQPGFTHWGAFAEYVSINYANVNLVKLPDSMDFETAASLGCRFTTSFRALVKQGQVSDGQWIAVHGCGGVGLSAIMIANALGANVIAIDVSEKALALAKTLGASIAINANQENNVVKMVKEISNGGVHVSIDALGSRITCFNSISNLRKRGKHIQVGLLAGDQASPQIPMEKVIAGELEIIGSHGMQAHAFPEMLDMIESGKLQPQKLIQKMISLEEAPAELMAMDDFYNLGITVINQF